MADSNEEYLNKFLNTDFNKLDKCHIDHIALMLRQKDLFNNDDWLEKKLQNPNSNNGNQLIKGMPERFFWKLCCLLNDKNTAESTFNTIVLSLYEYNLPEACQLEFACKDRKNDKKTIDRENDKKTIDRENDKKTIDRENDKKTIDRENDEKFHRIEKETIATIESNLTQELFKPKSNSKKCKISTETRTISPETGRELFYIKATYFTK